MIDVKFSHIQHYLFITFLLPYILITFVSMSNSTEIVHFTAFGPFYANIKQTDPLDDARFFAFQKV